MKYKKILIFVLVFALIFSPVSVCAEMEGNTASTEWGDSLDGDDSTEDTTDLPDATVDEGGWYSSGVANISFCDTGYNNIIRYWNYTLNGTKLYVIYNYNDISYTVYSSSNVVVTNNYSTSKGDSGSWTQTGTTTRELVYSNNGIHTDIIFSTNLPVFSFGDTEAIDAYLNNGDITGASNYDDLIPEEKVEVPKVKNLKITNGFYEGSRKENVWAFSTPISIEWNVDDTTDLRYQVQYRCVFYVLDEYKNPSASFKTVSSDWIDDARGLPAAYGDKSSPYSYKVSANKLESLRDELMVDSFNNSNIYEILKNIADFPTKILLGNFSAVDIAGVVASDYFFANHCVQIRVRNYIGDAFGSGTYGDWTTVVLDYDDNSSTGYTGDSDDEEGSTEEVDWESDGRVDEDDITIEVDWDSDGDGSTGLLDAIKGLISFLSGIVASLITGIVQIISSLTNGITKVINFITSGFGLFGDNGLLKLFNSTFIFIPEDVWTILEIGIGLVIILCVIRFFKK